MNTGNVQWSNPSTGEWDDVQFVSIYMVSNEDIKADEVLVTHSEFGDMVVIVSDLSTDLNGVGVLEAEEFYLKLRTDFLQTA